MAVAQSRPHNRGRGRKVSAQAASSFRPSVPRQALEQISSRVIASKQQRVEPHRVEIVVRPEPCAQEAASWAGLLDDDDDVGPLHRHRPEDADAGASDAEACVKVDRLTMLRHNGVSGLPMPNSRAVHNTLWHRLVEDDAKQPPLVRGIIGASLYAGGDAFAQLLEHGGQLTAANFNVSELVCMTCLGLLMEGKLNDWWNQEVDRRTMGYSERAARSLRFIVNYLVWIPLCCELCYVMKLLFIEGYIGEVLGFVTEGNRWGAGKSLEQLTESLVDDVSVTGGWQMAGGMVVRVVPGPLRPLLRKLMEAGSWTLLGAFEPEVVEVLDGEGVQLLHALEGLERATALDASMLSAMATLASAVVAVK